MDCSLIERYTAAFQILQTHRRLSRTRQQKNQRPSPLQTSSTPLKIRTRRWRIWTWSQPAAAHKSPASSHTKTLKRLLNHLRVRKRKTPASVRSISPVMSEDAVHRKPARNKRPERFLFQIPVASLCCKLVNDSLMIRCLVVHLVML